MQKKIMTMLLCGVILLGMVGCKKETKVSSSTMNIDGITMEIKEGTLSATGLTLIIKDTTNEKYVFGEEFYIEKKVDNNWKKLSPIHDDYGFNAIAYFADAEKGLELNQNWEYIYGSLEEGTYRLVKTTSKESDSPITENDLKYLSVDFEITTSLNRNKNYDDYEKTSSLSSDNASTEILVKFDGVLYGKSNAMIDYAGGSESIGVIDQLIDQEYVPKLDGETNQQEILNALVFNKTDYTIVLQYNNEYVLFEKIR